VRFLLLNQFYPPDPAPTGRLLHDLGKVLRERGHEVRVVCSRLAYRGSDDWGSRGCLDGIEVFRSGGAQFSRQTVLGRLVAYLTFLATAFGAALSGPRPTIIVSLTTPPFLGLMGAITARLRGCHHAHWTMDLYPDALRAHWSGRGSRVLWAALEWLARAQFRGASVVVAPGVFLEARLRRYVPATVPLRTVFLWATSGPADPETVARARSARGWSPDDLVVMYSGNMGLGHRFSEFLDASGILGKSGPRWTFIGEGPRRGEIESFRASHKEARIELLPAVDSAALSGSLASADVHLVSVVPGWEGLMVPSKVQNVFAIGRPVIFLGSDATEVATWVRDSGGGWVVAPGDIGALLRAIDEARNPLERARRGQAAMEYARVHFDRTRNCAKLASLLEQC
jgi:putative colanic acid biosynthesis glycosyltransferase WcaI